MDDRHQKGLWKNLPEVMKLKTSDKKASGNPDG